MPIQGPDSPTVGVDPDDGQITSETGAQGRSADLLPQPASDFDGFAVMLVPREDDAADIAPFAAIDQSDLHTTLVFYGDADQYEDAWTGLVLADILRPVALTFEPIQATLGGVTRFSAEENDPVVLNVDSKDVHVLRQRVMERLSDECNMEEQTEHGYTPHMTLGYLPHHEPLTMNGWKPKKIVFDRLRVGFGEEQYDVYLGTGWDMKSVIRRVRTNEGVRRYNLPLGAIIGRLDQPEVLPLDVELPDPKLNKPRDMERLTKRPDIADVRMSYDHMKARVEQVLYQDEIDDAASWMDTPEYGVYQEYGISLDDVYNYPQLDNLERDQLLASVIAYGPWTGFDACKDIRRAAYDLMGFKHTDHSQTRGDSSLNTVSPDWGRGMGVKDPALHAYALMRGLKTAPKTDQTLYRGVKVSDPESFIKELREGDTFDMPIASFINSRKHADRFGTDVTFVLQKGARAVLGADFGPEPNDDPDRYDYDYEDDPEFFEYISGGRFKITGVRKNDKGWTLLIRQTAVFDPDVGILVKAKPLFEVPSFSWMFDFPLTPAVQQEDKGIRKVRTPAGARRYGQPIGTVIIPDPLPNLTFITRGMLSNPDTPRTRAVSRDEFQRLASVGKKKLDGYRKNASDPKGLDDKWDAIRNQAWESVQEEWGGLTVDAHTGVPLAGDERLYALTVKPVGMDSVSVPIGASREDFDRAMEEAREKFGSELRSQKHYLGIFRDEDSDRIDIDPVLVVDSVEDVETIGAYTNAVGGAYCFEDGNGYWPPYIDEGKKHGWQGAEEGQGLQGSRSVAVAGRGSAAEVKQDLKARAQQLAGQEGVATKDVSASSGNRTITHGFGRTAKKKIVRRKKRSALWGRARDLFGKDFEPDHEVKMLAHDERVEYKARVRTPAGVRKYGQPIGSLIIPGTKLPKLNIEPDGHGRYLVTPTDGGDEKWIVKQNIDGDWYAEDEWDKLTMLPTPDVNEVFRFLEFRADEDWYKHMDIGSAPRPTVDDLPYRIGENHSQFDREFNAKKSRKYIESSIDDYYFAMAPEGADKPDPKQITQAVVEMIAADYAKAPDNAVVFVPDLEVLEHILFDGRVKTQFESRISNGLYDPHTRRNFELKSHESKNMGIPKDIPDHQRPVYGAMEPYRKYSGAQTYGGISLKLKPDVNDRMTLCGSDSLDYKLVPVRPGETDPDAILATMPVVVWSRSSLSGYVERAMKQHYGIESDDPSPLESLMRSEYVELQVHGGVVLDDVESVGIPNVLWDSADAKRLRKALKKLGIKVHLDTRRH